MHMHKDFCGLQEIEALASQQPKKHITKHKHRLTRRLSGLWVRKNNNIIFTLEVDDFGVKNYVKEIAHYLIEALKHKCKDVDAN